jgi:hypothetical protein
VSRTRELTAERLREVLDYDPETGVFRWLVAPGCGSGIRTDLVGKPAGAIDSVGYRYIKIDGVKHSAARLARLYVTGEWPEAQVDHESRDRADNRYDNLRPATHQQNQANTAARKTNDLGVKGVSRHTGKYIARIWDGEKKRYLGRFSKLVDAAAAYNASAEEIQGEFSRQTQIIHVNVTKYGDGPLPANQVQVSRDGTVVDVSCIKYEPPTGE